MPTPSPTCQIKEGAGAWQSTTNGVDVTPAATITIGLVSTAGVEQWSITCIGTDESQVAATITSSLSINTVAKTATFTAPAAGSALIFQSVVNGGVDINGRDVGSYTTTFGIYTLTSVSGLRVVASNETTEGSAAYGWVAQANTVTREVDAALGLIGAPTTRKAVGTITKGYAYVSANDPVDADKVKVATLANLKAAGFVPLGVALATVADGATFAGAEVGSAIDSTIHGLPADASSNYSIVTINTSTGALQAQRKLDGTEAIIGTLSPGSGVTGGILTLSPGMPDGRPTVSILDPLFGLDLSTMVIDGALADDGPIERAMEAVGAGGRIVFPKLPSQSQQSVSTIYWKEREVYIDVQSNEVTPRWGMTFAGEAGRNPSNFGVQINSRMSDFTGSDAAILSVDATKNIFEVRIPITTLQAQASIGAWPVRPKMWVDHHLTIKRSPNDYHNGRFLVTGLRLDNTYLYLRCHLRGTWTAMQIVQAHGNFQHAAPNVTITGTTTQPVDFRMRVSTAGARGAAQVEISTDGGATYAAPVTTAATLAIGATGLTANLPTGNYDLDHYWVCRNLSGNDANNGSLKWDLLRWHFHRRGSQIGFQNLNFYCYQGNFFGGWHFIAEQTAPKVSTPITDIYDHNLRYGAYPESSFNASYNLLTNFKNEINGYGPSVRWAQYGEAWAWPVAPRPGHYRYYPGAAYAALTARANTTAVSTGDIRRPATLSTQINGGRGFQFRATNIATTGASEPAAFTSWSTTKWGTTIVDGGVTWKTEYVGEKWTAINIWTANEDLSAAALGTERRPSVQSGLKLVLVTKGICGSTEPTGYKWNDVVTSGTAVFVIDYDAEPTDLFAPYNNDYMHREQVNWIGGVGTCILQDNVHGQAREHYLFRCNPNGVTCGIATEPETRYTGEFGQYLQATWDGADIGCDEGGFLAPAGALNFTLKNFHSESCAYLGEYGAVAAGNLTLSDGRLSLGQPHVLQAAFTTSAEKTVVSNVDVTSFSPLAVSARMAHSASVAADASPTGVTQSLIWQGGGLSLPARSGTFARIRFQNRAPYSTVQNGQDLLLVLTPSTGHVYPFYHQQYAESFRDAWINLNSGGITAVGQATRGQKGANITGARFWLKKTGSPTGTAVVKIYAHTGTFGSGTPTGAALWTSDTIDVTQLSATFGRWVFFRFTPTALPMLADGTDYFFVLEYSGGDGSNYVEVGADTSASSGLGSAASFNGSWSALATTTDLIHSIDTSVFQPKFVTADFAAMTNQEGWEFAKRINKDAGLLWQPSTVYGANTVVTPRNGFQYRMDATGGTSGATEPTWPTTVGGTVADNGRTWTCENLVQPSLWSRCDRWGRIYVDSQVAGFGREPNAPKTPYLLACSLVVVGGSALPAFGGVKLVEPAYSAGEVGEASLNGISTNGNGDQEVDIVAARLIQDGSQVRNPSTLTRYIYVPFGGTASPTRYGREPAYENAKIITPSLVPLRNQVFSVTFTGADQLTAWIPFIVAENDASYHIRNPLPVIAKTGSPAAGTYTFYKTYQGVMVRRSAAAGGGASETVLVELVRLPPAPAWDPNKIVANNVNWYKSESLVAGAVASWANSGTVGSNRMTALAEATNQPVASLDAASGTMKAAFDGTNDRLRATLSSNYTEPFSILLVSGAITAPVAGTYYPFFGPATSTANGPSFSYRDNGAGSYFHQAGFDSAGAAVVTATAVSWGSGRHLLSVHYDNRLSGTVRMARWRKDLGIWNNFGVFANGGPYKMDGLTLCANAGASSLFMNTSIYELAVIEWDKKAGVNWDDLDKLASYMGAKHGVDAFA